MATPWDIPPDSWGTRRSGLLSCITVVRFARGHCSTESTDDLELLGEGVGTNKPLFARAERLATEVLTLTQESLTGASSPSS